MYNYLLNMYMCLYRVCQPQKGSLCLRFSIQTFFRHQVKSATKVVNDHAKSAWDKSAKLWRSNSDAWGEAKGVYIMARSY